jgi:outer membrane protein insertion porin family
MRPILLMNMISAPFIRPLLILCLFFYSCNITRKAPKGKPYLAKNSFEVNGGNFSNIEKSALLDRLAVQLDDSSKLTSSTLFFIVTVLKRPPAYDTAYSALSAANMKASMNHLGYYNSSVSYNADTAGRKVSVKYTVQAGNPTRIDTLLYQLNKPDLQALALKYDHESILVKNNPVTRAGVLGEIARQVDTFRNNGYYKFTAAELRLRGDTSIEALTNLSDDPFEQLQILADAQTKRDSPAIKLAMVLNKPQDSTKLDKYFINKIYVLPDYIPGDDLNDTLNITQRGSRNFVLRYHKPIFRTGFLARNITLRPGVVYSQREYNKTLSNIAKTGVWQTTNIQVRELKDSARVDLVVEMVPVKKFGFEAGVEASYSASNNSGFVQAGNLIGFSGNLSLVNRNIGREAISMTHRLRGGVELNRDIGVTNTGLLNSREFSYSNNVVIPRNIPFLPNFSRARTRRRNKPGESFINSSFSINDRLKLFNLQTVNLSVGKTIPDKKNNERRTTNWIFRPLSAQFSFLNPTDSFRDILAANRFLEYSYNTSFVVGMSGGFSTSYRNPKHLKSLGRERSINANIEESGLTWGLLPVLNKYKAKYIKLDAEYKYSVNYRKTALVLRAFTGIGIPILKDSALPFFKQFFGGGTYSMRGWPVRGIGRGGQALPAYKKNLFNDRTGDIQVEFNGEFRHNLATIFPNLLTLKGAVFADIGNVWNLNNLKRDGSEDSAQFKFKNLYKQMGLSAGYGFRLDFSYVVLRLDFGFRFKRPELSEVNDGWKAPPIGFDDFLKKIFTRGNDDEYRKWRYENFNFTIGISYPF